MLSEAPRHLRGQHGRSRAETAKSTLQLSAELTLLVARRPAGEARVTLGPACQARVTLGVSGPSSQLPTIAVAVSALSGFRLRLRLRLRVRVGRAGPGGLRLSSSGDSGGYLLLVVWSLGGRAPSRTLPMRSTWKLRAPQSNLTPKVAATTLAAHG